MLIRDVDSNKKDRNPPAFARALAGHPKWMIRIIQDTALNHKFEFKKKSNYPILEESLPIQPGNFEGPISLDFQCSLWVGNDP